MRILIEARMYGLENAGIGRYVMNLVGNLQKIDKRNKYIIVLRKKYFDQLKLNKNWKRVLFDHRHYSLAEQVGLPKLIENERADVVHFPHFNVPVKYGGKFVVTIHDLLMHRQKGTSATTLNPAAYYAKRLGYKRVFVRAVRKSAMIIVPSKLVKNDLLKHYEISEEKIAVTYEGVDKNVVVHKRRLKTTLRKYGLDEEYFIYAGNAYPHKNLARAIEAVVFLNMQSKNKVLLAIATSRGEFFGRLEKTIKDLRGEDYVRLLGFVPDEDLGNLYNQSLGFVFPTLMEGFGLPGLEAMGAGTLALISDIPVLKEVYKNKALYFNPHDFSSIERVMKGVVEMDLKRRRKRISEGKRFVKRYSWEKMARETLGVYEQATG